MKRNIYVFAIAGLIVLLQAATASALVITSRGLTEQEAIQNGLRTALEETVGAYVYATTDVKDFMLKKDQIFITSQGSIKSFKVINTGKIGELWFVTLDVDVDYKNIESIIRNNVQIITADDVMKDYHRVKNEMERLKRFDQILDHLGDRPVQEKYIISYEGYSIDKVGPQETNISFYIRLMLNPVWFQAVISVIKQIGSMNPCNNCYKFTIDYSGGYHDFLMIRPETYGGTSFYYPKDFIGLSSGSYFNIIIADGDPSKKSLDDLIKMKGIWRFPDGSTRYMNADAGAAPMYYQALHNLLFIPYWDPKLIGIIGKGGLRMRLQTIITESEIIRKLPTLNVRLSTKRNFP